MRIAAEWRKDRPAGTTTRWGPGEASLSAKLSIRRDRVCAQRPEHPWVRCAMVDRMVEDHRVPAVFFFDRELDADQLAHALGKVLGAFSPFGARLRRQGHELFLDGQAPSAAFSRVRRSITMEESIRRLRAGEASQLVDTLSPLHAKRFGGPLLTARVTQFADGRSALGMCWHHAVGDIHSFILLMRAWAQAASGQDFVRPLVVEDREDYLAQELSRFTGAPSGLRYLSSRQLVGLGLYALANARSKRIVTLYFDEEEGAALRSAVQADAATHITESDALCAHVLSVVNACDPTPRARSLSLAVNYRKRAGLPEGLLGNMVALLNTSCAAGARAADVARDVRRGLNHFAEQHLDYRANRHFIHAHGGPRRLKRCVPLAIDPQRGAMLVTNWSRLGVYDLAFGSARPVFFTGMLAAAMPWLGAVFDGSQGHGRLFSLVLPSHVAERMRQPQSLQALHRYRSRDHYAQRALEHSLPWIH
ncbi:MAG TPA: acyltransferase [Polyangiales bacterium]